MLQTRLIETLEDTPEKDHDVSNEEEEEGRDENTATRKPAQTSESGVDL